MLAYPAAPADDTDLSQKVAPLYSAQYYRELAQFEREQESQYNAQFDAEDIEP